jgi:hypothetical protein
MTVDDRSELWFAVRWVTFGSRLEHTFSEAAPGLAADWENLVAEIMARFQTRLRGEEPERVGMSTGG